MQRIPQIEKPFSDEVQESFDIIMPKGSNPLKIFTTVANNPRVLNRMVKGGLLDKGSVSIAQRELAILRTCGLCKAEYEWGVHVAIFAKKAGFTDQQVSNTYSETIDHSIWNEEQLLILKLCDELHENSNISEQLWTQLKETFADEQLIELTMLAGLYHAVSYLVNGFNVELEEFAPRFG